MEDLRLQKTGKPALVIAKNAHTGPWPPPRRVRNIMSAIMLRRSRIQPRCPTRVSTARPALVVEAGTCLEVTAKRKKPVPGRSCLATGISHRYTEKSDRRPDIPRNRYQFSPPGWWLGTPRCRMYRSLWIYLTI